LAAELFIAIGMAANGFDVATDGAGDGGDGMAGCDEVADFGALGVVEGAGSAGGDHVFCSWGELFDRA
jgi:hypothetical protein